MPIMGRDTVTAIYIKDFKTEIKLYLKEEIISILKKEYII